MPRSDWLITSIYFDQSQGWLYSPSPPVHSKIASMYYSLPLVNQSCICSKRRSDINKKMTLIRLLPCEQLVVWWGLKIRSVENTLLADKRAGWQITLNPNTWGPKKLGVMKIEIKFHSAYAHAMRSDCELVIGPFEVCVLIQISLKMINNLKIIKLKSKRKILSSYPQCTAFIGHCRCGVFLFA